MGAVSWRALGTVALVVGGTACDRDEQTASAAAQVLVTIVREAAEDTPPRPDPDQLPVVYVVSTAEDGIQPRVQAAVANTLNGEVAVRFADARREALDEERAGSPVRDHGCLVDVGHISESADAVEVEVEFYRSETQFSRRVVTFVESSGAWSVTSSSVLEEHDEPSTSASDDDETGDAGPGRRGDDDGSSPSAPVPSGPASATAVPATDG